MVLQSYSPFLIILSVFIGIISSYTALLLVERISNETKLRKRIWVLLGSFIMGLGIFSVHYIGMLSYHIGFPVTYKPFLLFVSLIISITSSFFAFSILYIQQVSKYKVYISGLITGTGIVCMHYVGMAAIQHPMEIQYTSIYFLLSIFIAMFFSSIAIKLFFAIKQDPQTSIIRNIGCAVILGLTISFMHYIGVKATFFTHANNMFLNGIGTFELVIIVSLSIIIIMVVSIVSAVFHYRTINVERQLMIQIKESEARYRQLVELSPEPIVVHSGQEIVFINEACLKMINLTDKHELIGKSILDFVPSDSKTVIMDRIQHMKEGLRAKLLEQQITIPDGSIIDVEVTGVGIMYEEKPSILLILRDITEQKRIGKELKENQQRYQSLFTHNPDAVYSLDSNGNLININQALENISGYSKQELSTMTFYDLVDQNYLYGTHKSFQKALGGIPQNYESVGIHKNGKNVPLNITNMPIIVEGEIIGVYGVAKDISKEKETLRLLEENEEKYRSLFDHNLDAIFEINTDGTYRNVNKMAEELLGFSKDELLNMPYSSLIAANLETVNEDFSLVKKGKPLFLEQTMKTKSQAPIEVDVNAVPIRIQGKLSGVFAIVRDITDEKQMKKRINELAYTDQLTGLPNRHWFYSNLTNVINKAKQQREPVAILAIDFDNFKGVNDMLGHHAGDLFLVKVADRMKSCLRENDKIARIGGDEFIIVLENVTEDDASQIAQRILNEMNQSILLIEHEIVVTLSVGISMLIDNSIIDTETLIKQADLAMYLAKEKGKNNYQFFTKDLNEKVTRKLQLENALRSAIEREEFTLYYQPQVDLQTGKLVGIEALLRWNSSFGVVSPSEFIPIAEETGLILPIGEWVIRKACRQIKEWENQALPKVRVSVNVSARQFKDQDFATKVRKIMEEEKVDPYYFEIEITESVMLDVKESSQVIKELKKLGIKVAIDDFGAGYSSLNVIKNVVVDTLKIDKSLIEGVQHHEQMMSTLIAIISVGKKLNTNVIVEGIETKIQKDLLEEFNVVGQGYYFSHPLPPEQMEDVWDKFYMQKQFVVNNSNLL